MDIRTTLQLVSISCAVISVALAVVARILARRSLSASEEAMRLGAEIEKKLATQRERLGIIDQMLSPPLQHEGKR